MEKKTFRTAVVGLGVIGQIHFGILCDSDFAEAVAVCDTDEKKLDFAKKRLQNVKLYQNYEQMIDEVKPDAVHICTPHYLHTPMAIYALKHGVNVLLEKPVAISEEEIRALLKAEAESSAKIAVCFQNRLIPAVCEAKRILDEDGGALTGYCSVVWNRGADYYASGEWRGKWATEGGGVLINQAIHSLDMLNFCLGTPKKLTATVANRHLKGVIEVEDTAEGNVTYENGKTAVFYATNAFAGEEETVIAFQSANKRVSVTNGKLYVGGEPVPTDSPVFAGKPEYGPGHPILISAFYHALKNGLPMPVSVKDGANALRIVLGAYRSENHEITLGETK